jgi:type I restriction enzyme, S subunit
MSSIMREDWIECTLDEVCEVLDNLRKPINSTERNERIKGKDTSELFPYYGATGQVGFIDDFLTDGDYVLLGEDAAPFLDFTKDVAYKITGKTWVNNHAHILKSHFNDDFLLHFLNQFQYRDYVTGTTRLKLTQGALKRMPAKLAPLPIQRAIVSKIEALFSDLDNGIANFKKAQEQLKIYRQAVLKKAFEGKLSEPLINNDLSDDTDFKSENEKSSKSFNHKNPSSDNLPNGWKWVKLSEPLINNDLSDDTDFKSENEKSSKSFNHKNPSSDNLPEAWKSVKLGEVAEVKRGKSKHRPRNDSSLFGGKYPFIQTGEIRAANGGTIHKYSITYSEKGLAQSKLWKKGTLCLTIAANIGETAFLGFDACFPDSVVGIISKDELLNIKFFNLYIQKVKKEIENSASATAQKNINVEFLESLLIPLPPTITEQKQIVQEIESRLSVCDKVEQSLNESLKKAEALRQSILKKAFEGKLLSQAEIDQCKKEADYEPASELLKKITNEKLRITKKGAKK